MLERMSFNITCIFVPPLLTQGCNTVSFSCFFKNVVKQVCAVATAVKVLHSSQHFDLQLYNSSKWCSSFGQTSLPDVASRYGEWLVCGASLKWPSWLHFISSRNCCMVPREVCFKYSTEKKNIGFHVQQQATKLTPCSYYWYTAYGTNYFAYYLWGDIGLLQTFLHFQYVQIDVAVQSTCTITW